MLPRVACEPPLSDDSRTGWITGPGGVASLLLVDEAGAKLRVSWDEVPASTRGEAGAPDLRRALDPGRYRVQGTRLTRLDEAGVPWFLSALSTQGPALEIAEGKGSPAPAMDTVRLTWQAKHPHGVLRLQAGLAGATPGGLTLYRDGRRIPIGYRIVDDQGLELETGDLQYG